MALSAGNKPTVWNSILSDYTLALYNERLSQGLINETQFSQTIEGTTYSETDDNFHARVLLNKLNAWTDAYVAVSQLTTVASANIKATNGATIGQAGTYPVIAAFTSNISII